jgi:hypothetical protein
VIAVATMPSSLRTRAVKEPFLGEYFDLSYVITLDWLWRVFAVLAVSLVPVWAGKMTLPAYTSSVPIRQKIMTGCQVVIAVATMPSSLRTRP